MYLTGWPQWDPTNLASYFCSYFCGLHNAQKLSKSLSFHFGSTWNTVPKILVLAAGTCFFHYTMECRSMHVFVVKGPRPSVREYCSSKPGRSLTNHMHFVRCTETSSSWPSPLGAKVCLSPKGTMLNWKISFTDRSSWECLRAHLVSKGMEI